MKKEWPAWQGSQSWPGRIRAEQGVWGKVHRQASDFRWIASSPGLDLRDLGPALGVGAEDQPVRCVFWRRLEDGRCLAVAAYPSRAVDAAGRSGFLERRILVWNPGPETSIVQGMLALLPSAAERYADRELAASPGNWLQPDFRLPLEAQEIEVPVEELESRAEEGRRWLLEHVDEEGLTALYARLLARRRPAVLPSPTPLPPAALAALLLPLPKNEAEGSSLAGWIPSSRVGTSSLADHWHLVAGQISPPALEPSAEQLETARQRARALVAGDPSRIEREPLYDLVPPDFPFVPFEEAFGPLPDPGTLPPWLRRIRTFVEDPGARWLDPAETARDLPLDAPAAPTLAAWRKEVIASMPEGADTWQWTVKVDLLAALLVAVAPSSPEAGHASFRSGRVPALLFVCRLGEAARRSWRCECPRERLEDWGRQIREVAISTRHFLRSSVS